MPLPLDVGWHELVVSGRGYKTRKQRIEIAADRDRVAVPVPPLESMTIAGPNPERPWQRPAAIVAMGLGGAGLAAGAVLGGLAIARNQESNDGHCSAQDRCDSAGLVLRRQAVGLGNGSTVALVAGGLLAAGGAVLFATAPSHAQRDERAQSREAQWRAVIALLPGSVAVQGVW